MQANYEQFSHRAQHIKFNPTWKTHFFFLNKENVLGMTL